MVFTQGRGFVLGGSFGLRIRSLRCRDLVCHTADTASLATWPSFGKLFGVATLVGFGEKRCRKNLPLDGPHQLKIQWLTQRCDSLDPLDIAFQEMSDLELSDENKRKLAANSGRRKRWATEKWLPFVADPVSYTHLTLPTTPYV